MAGITGKVVVITGASSALGEAAARALAAAAKLVLGARRLERLQALVAELGTGIAVRTDVSSRAEVQALVDQGGWRRMVGST